MSLLDCCNSVPTALSQTTLSTVAVQKYKMQLQSRVVCNVNQFRAATCSLTDVLQSQKVAWWHSQQCVKTCDQVIKRLTPGWALLHSYLGQVIHTCVPLSQSGVICYWCKGADALWLRM